jgi:phosphatidylinositol alpha 1,6-mannosyltransferase
VKVAIVAESFLPAVNGVTNSVLRVLEHLERRGHDALVVAAGPGPDRYAGARVARVPAVALPVYRSFPVALPTPRVEAALAEFAPDVVHLASPAALGAIGASAARRLRVPAVAVFQSDLAGFAARYGLGFAAPGLWAWLRWIHTRTALTLAPSSATMWELERHGIGPVARWSRGVDAEHFHPRCRSDRLRRQLAPGGEAVVGYLGRLASEKQVHRLAHLAGLPGCRLVLIGDGPARRSLERRLPDARFLGFLTGTELWRAVASLDVCVHTGTNETFCQALQEAMAAGVPVVSPATGGPLDLVRHGENGWLFAAEQPVMLRSAVAALVADPLRRARMGEAARASVVHRTWSAVCDELLDHYRAVAERGEEPRARAA